MQDGNACSGTLQQLGSLTGLRNLRLSTALTGRLYIRVPTGLSLLTCLEAHGRTHHAGALASSLALMPHLQRLSWESTGMLYLGWPDGIASLTQLTYLNLRDRILLPEDHWHELPAPPPSLAGHTRLVHLHIGGWLGQGNWALPDLRPLAASLRCLRCRHCTGEAIRQALPALSHLTALVLVSCTPSPVETPGDLAHMSQLQYRLVSASPFAFCQSCPEHWPLSEDGM